MYLEPVEDAVKVGDTFVLKIVLQDETMARPVEDCLTVQIIEEDREPRKPKIERDTTAGDKGDMKDSDGPFTPTRRPSTYRLLTRDGRMLGNQETLPWPEGFNELDGGLIEDLGEEGVLYKINYDNSYHLKYRMGARGDVARDVMTEKYILGMRILLVGYENALRAVEEIKGDDAAGMAKFFDDFRRISARGSAATVLALAENLPKIVDRSAVATSQDVE